MENPTFCGTSSFLYMKLFLFVECNSSVDGDDDDDDFANHCLHENDDGECSGYDAAADDSDDDDNY